MSRLNYSRGHESMAEIRKVADHAQSEIHKRSSENLKLRDHLALLEKEALQMRCVCVVLCVYSTVLARGRCQHDNETLPLKKCHVEKRLAFDLISKTDFCFNATSK